MADFIPYFASYLFVLSCVRSFIALFFHWFMYLSTILIVLQCLSFICYILCCNFVSFYHRLFILKHHTFIDCLLISCFLISMSLSQPFCFSPSFFLFFLLSTYADSYHWCCRISGRFSLRSS